MTSETADAVVVAYRSAEVLRDCVRSLRRDASVDRIVVVNNNPGDGAGSVLEGIDRVEYVEAPGNIGFGPAINSIRDRIHNEYVVLANPDTTQSGDTVTKSIEFLERHPRAALVGPRMVYPDGTLARNSAHFISLVRMIAHRLGWPDRLRVSRSRTDHDREHLTEYVIASFVTCRRTALDQVDWFDETIFLFGEDQDLCRRLAAAGWEIWFAPIGEVVHSSGHSWRQLNDRARSLFRRARARELRAQGRHVAAALYLLLEPLSQLMRRS
jgi:GT2 family glycosyltransferase